MLKTTAQRQSSAAFFSFICIRFGHMTVTGYQRESVFPTFQVFLYLAHPPHQMIQPKATDGKLKPDKTFISMCKQKDQINSNHTVLLEIYHFHVGLWNVSVHLKFSAQCQKHPDIMISIYVDILSRKNFHQNILQKYGNWVCGQSMSMIWLLSCLEPISVFVL